MNIKIEFFKENFINAIGAGIYEIIVKYQDEEKLLYIGESVFVLVRCATHLFKLKKDPNYLGFTDGLIENNDITLKFELWGPDNEKELEDATVRKEQEKRLIQDCNPIMQSGISDRMKSVEEKIEILTEFLNSMNKGGL